MLSLKRKERRTTELMFSVVTLFSYVIQCVAEEELKWSSKLYSLSGNNVIAFCCNRHCKFSKQPLHLLKLMRTCCVSKSLSL